MGLDPDQQAVANWSPASKKHFRVTARAGSGKSTTMAALVCNLIERQDVDPSRLVVTTFTRKGGEEIAKKLKANLNKRICEQIRVGTFHSLALRTLKLYDVDGAFDIRRCIDTDAGTRGQGVPPALGLWNHCITDKKIPGTSLYGVILPRLSDRKKAPERYMRSVAFWKNKGYHTPDDLPPEAHKDPTTPELYLVWKKYAEAKKELKVWEYMDLLVRWKLGMAMKIPGTNKPYIVSNADIVLIDEAQDTSATQMEIARLLVRYGQPDSGYIGIFGDLAQLVHEHAGADSDIFLNFVKDEECIDFPLRYNYRSKSELVHLGNRVLTKIPNAGEAAKSHHPAGAKIQVMGGFADLSFQADWMANEIEALKNANVDMGEIAILARTNAALGDIEVALEAKKIPNFRLGSDSIFNSREGRVVAAYAAFKANPSWGLATEVQNYPLRYISYQDMQLGMVSSSNVVPVLKNSRNSKLNALGNDLDRVVKSSWEDMPFVIRSILHLDKEDRKDRWSESADGDEFSVYEAALRILRRFKDASHFADFVEKMKAKTKEKGDEIPPGKVVLATIHKIKGMQWDRVYMMTSEGILPHWRSLATETKEALTSERRLFYVGVTRPKTHLTLCYDIAGHGQGENKYQGPSQFLREFVPESQFLWEKCYDKSNLAALEELAEKEKENVNKKKKTIRRSAVA